MSITPLCLGKHARTERSVAASFIRSITGRSATLSPIAPVLSVVDELPSRPQKEEDEGCDGRVQREPGQEHLPHPDMSVGESHSHRCMIFFLKTVELVIGS